MAESTNAVPVFYAAAAIATALVRGPIPCPSLSRFPCYATRKNQPCELRRTFWSRLLSKPSGCCATTHCMMLS